MTATPGSLLTLIDDPELYETVERVAAAVEFRMVAVADVPTRRAWLSATAVVLDEAAARRCISLGLPRREAVGLLTVQRALLSAWEAAIAVGAQHVYQLPSDEEELMRRLAEAADSPAAGARPGQIITVIAGRGGAGASVLSAALALTAGTALLIDLDPWSGGLDLLLGHEATSGLRWPDLVLQGGRLNWESVREALPRHGGMSVLSGARRCHELESGPVESVINAARRGGVAVICDVPRRMTDAVLCAVDAAELLVVITTCDVRGVAATSALVPVIRAVNPNIGLLVRGPAPGGLRPGEIADAAGLPVIAVMRPEPMLEARLDRGGLRLRRRSPLAIAAREVFAVLEHRYLGQAA